MRVSAKPLGEFPWYLRPFFWNQKRKYGQVLLPGEPDRWRKPRHSPAGSALDVPAQGFCSLRP